MPGRKKKIGQLKIGDMVAIEGGGRVRISHSAADPSIKVHPHRKSAPRGLVSGWYLIWRIPGEPRDAGEVFDPDDEVFLA